MSSQAQIDANRLNSLLSTGPTSPEGKAKVSKNRLDHGYSANSPFVPEELKDDFDQLKSRLLNACRPKGDLETELAHRLIHSAWNLTRLDFHEADLLFHSDSNPFADEKLHKGLALLLRYRNTHTSVFFRNLRELRQLQTDRAALSGFHVRLQEPIEQESPLAYITRLTNHTDLALSLDRNKLHRAAEGQRIMEKDYEEAKAMIAAGDPETRTPQFKANFELLKAVNRPPTRKAVREMLKFAAL